MKKIKKLIEELSKDNILDMETDKLRSLWDNCTIKKNLQKTNNFSKDSTKRFTELRQKILGVYPMKFKNINFNSGIIKVKINGTGYKIDIKQNKIGKESFNSARELLDYLLPKVNR